MKVLFVGMTKNKGGTETYILNTANVLWQKTDAELYFLDTEEEGIVCKKYILKKGGKVISYSIHRGLLGLVYNSKEANRFFKTHHFDVVDVNVNILRNSFWAIAAKRSGVKKVFVHSHNSSYGVRSKIKQFVYKITDKIDRIKLSKENIKLFAASIEAGKWMFHGLPFEVIHNGIDTERFKFSKQTRKSMRQQLKIGMDELVLISVARFSYQKNQEKSVMIFNEILKNRPDSYLLFVGSGDEEQIQLIKCLVNHLGIQKRVLFLGYREDIPELLSASDIMLFPSRYEGTPYALIEAESSGLAIVVSQEAFRTDENLSNLVKFCSLNDSNVKWAVQAMMLFEQLNNAPEKIRLIANEKVNESRYSLKTFDNQITNLYFPIDDEVRK